MNILSRTITGLFLILLGIVFFALSIIFSWVFLIYALPCLLIGFLIFFNKKEDNIEQIKEKTKLKGGGKE